MNTTSPSRSGRVPLFLVLLAALAAGLGLWAGQKFFLGSGTPLPETRTTRLLDPPRILPEFSLQTINGGTLASADLKGRFTLVFLGFTHCPDVCPMTLLELAQAEKRWQQALPEAQHPRILLVSVDPERDNPELLNQYATHFSPTILSGTSDVESLTRLAKSLSMVFAKTPLGPEPQNYTIDHTSWVAVLDPDAHLAGFIRPPLDPEAIAQDLQTLVEAR
ncbi:SCO family protein [Denitratimonas sp. CY0512]|uniref:SCO family protein n=1 Tax=Denitratimonas sp. CY0512 TaxID=3131940 RepID=UPI0030A5F7C2